MHQACISFYLDEDGAVSVDWVVLTAAMMLLGVLIVGSIAQPATDNSTSLGARLSQAKVPALDLKN